MNSNFVSTSVRHNLICHADTIQDVCSKTLLLKKDSFTNVYRNFKKVMEHPAFQMPRKKQK